MMLNDIIAIRNASDKFSGTGRPQALKDGSFAGLSLFTDDPESQQKIFLSVLSQLGTGTTMAEESKNANLKLAEGRLTDEVRAGSAVAGKSKTKTDKDGVDVKRLASAYPETLGLVMGLMSISEPPQPGPSADPSLHAPDTENEQESTSDLPVGKLIPEMTATQGLPGERNSQAGNLSMAPVLDGSIRDSAVPVKGVATGQGRRAEPSPAQGPISSVADPDKTVPSETDSAETGLAEAVLTEAGLAQTADVKAPGMFQGLRQSVATVSEPDLSVRGRVQAVPVKGLTRSPGQRAEPSPAQGSISSVADPDKTVPSESAPVETGLAETGLAETVSTEAGLARTADVKAPGMFQGRRQSATTVSEPDLSVRGRVQAVPVKGLTRSPGQRAEPSPVQGPISSVAGPDNTVPSETVPVETGLAETGLAETVSTEAGLAQTADVKAPGMLQDWRQSVALVPEPDLSVMGRLQAVPVEGTPKLHRQQRKPLSIPDTVNLNPLAEKIDPGVKGDQTQRLSSKKSMDATVREKMPTYQASVPDIRPQSVKVESASFYQTNDAVETIGIGATSAATSNADDSETSNMFIALNRSGIIAGGEDGTHFQPLEPESGGLAVSLARGSQMEKTSWVNPSAKESRPDGQPFHAEVLNQVAEKTSTCVKSGQSEIRIDLKPESLGHLRLHVLTDHQQVTVKILAENPQVKEMIENQASLIKNELQNQGIHVNTVKVEMLMSGGSNFAYSQNEANAFRQPRHEPAYGSGKENTGETVSKEKDPLDQASNRGGSLVNYFA